MVAVALVATEDDGTQYWVWRLGGMTDRAVSVMVYHRTWEGCDRAHHMTVWDGAVDRVTDCAIAVAAARQSSLISVSPARNELARDESEDMDEIRRVYF